MKTAFTIVYEVWASTDERGPAGYTVGYVSGRVGAEILAKGKGYWGSDGSIREHKAVQIDGHFYILGNDGEPVDVDGKLSEERARIREHALSKLDKVEREVLGIKS